MTEPKAYITDHEMITEIRADLRLLKDRFYAFTDGVVTKEEFNMWEQARRTTVRWAIGTIVSVLTIAVAAVGVVLAALS